MPSAEAVKATPKLLKELNVTPDEYDWIVKLMGRSPTLTELGIFSVMHSEHCSYKSSKIYLKTFPTKGKGVLVRAGEENAGIVDIGGGVGIAFKVESHNHPSAVEPHAGAATGVGGILRDIFTMGARPIALFDSLRFGPLTPPPVWSAKGRRLKKIRPTVGRQTGGGVNGSGRTKFLFGGVVKGISDYGNAVGVPTVGGEIYFDATYKENPLVNVMCIGVVRTDRIAKAKASGVGNPVLYVGSSTGRDGLGGASFASREITDGSEADRPAVQIGDPFAEKCVLEATLEALDTDDVVAIQDMGAAGLTCSTCETASRGRCGIEIDVAKVPRREAGMTPFEVMLSESQERMLIIAKRGREERVKRLFARWGLHAVEIGTVTGGDLMRVTDGGTVVAEIPVGALTHDAPVYHRPVKRPAYLARAQRLSLRSVPPTRDEAKTLLALLASPTIASKAFVFEQYDHMVQTNTAVLPGRADAAVLRIKGTESWLAATTDANAAYCYLDPYEGGKLAVAEAGRNLACVGAVPLAVTDCLNFGNPENPEIMWQFRECVRGISDACRAFSTPVTGGNVSFYNESPRGAIDPTPVIGMVGLLRGVAAPITSGFRDEGDAVLLLGETREELGGSEYLKLLHGRKQGKPPRCHLAHERRLQRFMAEAARRGWIKSAHDCSEGGLAVALAECCIIEEDHLIGATIQFGVRSSEFGMKTPHLRRDALLFGESAGRIVITCEASRRREVEAAAAKAGLPAAVLGEVGGARLRIDAGLDVPVAELSGAWRSALARALTG